MLRRVVQIGIIALLLAAGALAFAVYAGDGLSRGLAAAALAATLIAVGAILANGLIPPPGPPINDVTTDPDDPPRLEAVLNKHAPGARPVERGLDAAAAARQREAHPEVHPIRTPLPPRRALDHAVEIAESMGWDLVARDEQAGTIEAVATTTFFRFKDDVVVRVRPDGDGSRVDLRSASRIGRSDLGKNAARIVEFSERFSAAEKAAPGRHARAHQE